MCGDYNLRREKRYVEVDVRFTPDGKIRPLAIQQMQVINGKPIHCHPLDVIRF